MKVLNKGEIKEQKWKLRNILLAITSCNLNKYMYSLHKEKLQQWGDVYQNWFLSKRSSKSRKPFLQYVTLHSCITIIRKKKKKNNETWAVEKWNPYRKQRWITSLLSFALTSTRLDFSLLETTANLTPSYLLDIPSNLKNYIDLIQKVSYLFCYWIFVLWQFTTHWATSQKTATRWNLISSPGKK